MSESIQDAIKKGAQVTVQMWYTLYEESIALGFTKQEALSLVKLYVQSHKS